MNNLDQFSEKFKNIEDFKKTEELMKYLKLFSEKFKESDNEEDLEKIMETIEILLKEVTGKDFGQFNKDIEHLSTEQIRNLNLKTAERLHRNHEILPAHFIIFNKTDLDNKYSNYKDKNYKISYDKPGYHLTIEFFIINILIDIEFIQDDEFNFAKTLIEISSQEESNVILIDLISNIEKNFPFIDYIKTKNKYNLKIEKPSPLYMWEELINSIFKKLLNIEE